ncbi:MAG: tungsten ABC transporter substrate-binding protein [Spirochaetes bacterium DG_61]|nr:MAG: tungsten ABC transporter substrate-binding protein [Spirochaetes bacterium DG_61]
MRGIKKYVLFFAVLLIMGLSSSALQATEGMLMMATTTSTDNTGLLDYLQPLFKTDTGIEIRWVAVGTGKALELGKNCDVDVLMVHAPAAEKKYIADGYGVQRTQIMYNDFVFIGPESDPAGVEGKSVSDALSMITSRSARFSSRGDDSGTHKMEIGLWKSAGFVVPDRESWYIQTGQGMLSTINIAAEIGAYTLTDRGTYIKYEANFGGNPPLVILVEGDPQLRNQYSVIMVNPERCQRVQKELVKEFIRWITSPRTQGLIGDFRMLGKQLFIPNAKE